MLIKFVELFEVPRRRLVGMTVGNHEQCHLISNISGRSMRTQENEAGVRCTQYWRQALQPVVWLPKLLSRR